MTPQLALAASPVSRLPDPLPATAPSPQAQPSGYKQCWQLEGAAESLQQPRHHAYRHHEDCHPAGTAGPGCALPRCPGRSMSSSLYGVAPALLALSSYNLTALPRFSPLIPRSVCGGRGRGMSRMNRLPFSADAKHSGAESGKDTGKLD